MAIRKILVPIRGDGKGEGVLDHAVALGQRFNAHILAVHCRPRPEDLLPFGAVMPGFLREQILSSADSVSDAEEARLRHLFQDYCAQRGISSCDGSPAPDDRITITWREEQGKQPTVIGRLGRLVDLIATAQPERESRLGANTLEAAMLNTGRPVLMCPPRPVSSVGERVAVAWSGSKESARAVWDAIPLLKHAKVIRIINGDTGRQPSIPPEELAAYLADHRIAAPIERFKSDPDEVGQALLRMAHELDADLLVMGAYGQSRGRELVLGGVTQFIVDSSDLPVLMAH